MKLRFFSTLSAFIVIAALLPAQSVANEAIKHTVAKQPHQTTDSLKEPDTAQTHRLKQARTTVDIFPGGTGDRDDNPLSPRTLSPGDGTILPDPPGDSGLVTLHHTRRGASTGHTDQFANYKSWGGGNWTARINSAGQFTHTQQGAGSGHTDTIINYITWDGQAWTATIDPASKVFTHTRQGASTSHNDTILNYMGWDGSQWTLRLQ